MNINTDKLKRADEHFDKIYGKKGSPSRIAFETKAKAWYYAGLLKDARIKEKMTQSQLAEKIGKNREYISLLEQGKTDMQLSTFFSIAEALNIKVSII